MKSVTITLEFYYQYVEYLRALIKNEQPKGLDWKHYFAIFCNYGYRPKAYEKVFEITRRHFPEFFTIPKWKSNILELVGLNPKEHRPPIVFLSDSIKNKSNEKIDSFFKDLYAGV